MEKSYELVVNNSIYYMDKQGEKNRDYQKKNDSKNDSRNGFLGGIEWMKLACLSQ